MSGLTKEAGHPMTKEEVLKGLREGRELRCDRRDEPLLPWLLAHPQIESSNVVQSSSQSSYISFCWKGLPDDR